MLAIYIFSYFYIASGTLILTKTQQFAGDITHRIKICRQTTWHLYPQFADSMSPPPRRHICTIRYVFLLKYIAPWTGRMSC